MKLVQNMVLRLFVLKALENLQKEEKETNLGQLLKLERHHFFKCTVIVQPSFTSELEESV